MNIFSAFINWFKGLFSKSKYGSGYQWKDTDKILVCPVDRHTSTFDARLVPSVSSFDWVSEQTTALKETLDILNNENILPFKLEYVEPSQLDTSIFYIPIFLVKDMAIDQAGDTQTFLEKSKITRASIKIKQPTIFTVFKHVLMHELLHALGLTDHSKNTNDVGTSGSYFPLVFSSNDFNALRKLYKKE